MKKMNKKTCYLVILLAIVLTINFVSAANKVAYIYKSKVDGNILDSFSSMGMDVTLVKEKEVGSFDFSGYNLLFIGDEGFKTSLPIKKYSSVLMNHYILKDQGFVGSGGVSRLVSTMPLEVNYNNKNYKVYSSAKDSRGISISYYYLDNQNKAKSFERLAGTYSTSSGVNFGDVVSLVDGGSKLIDGSVTDKNLCFFGISKTGYWTDSAEMLFEECVKFAYDASIDVVINETNETFECSSDSDCGEDGFFGDVFCKSNDVFGDYISYKCINPGTNSSYCTNESSEKFMITCSEICSQGSCQEVIECSNDSVCDDKDSSTYDRCLNPGTGDSKCVHSFISCSNNSECNDNNSTTEDVCIRAGSFNSACIHNIYTTKLRVVSLVATASENSVLLNFSASSEDNSSIKSYLVSLERGSIVSINPPNNSYVFKGLNPGTSYTFYLRVIDNLDRISEELSTSVVTLSPASPDSGPGSGSGSGSGSGDSSLSLGSSGGGGMSWCSSQWECSSWSECSNGKQTRTCSPPSGKCTPETSKPSESQSCSEAPKTETVSNTNTGENKTPSEAAGEQSTGNGITGAAIGAALKKYSWVAIVVIAVIIGVLYLYARGRRKASA